MPGGLDCIVLCGERPYIKNLLSPFWFLSWTHSLRDPAHWGRETEIDGRLVPPGRAYNRLADHPMTGYLLSRPVPVQKKWFSQTIHTCKALVVYLGGGGAVGVIV